MYGFYYLGAFMKIHNAIIFVSADGKKKNIISATIERDDVDISITTHEERLNQILSKIKKTGMLYEKAPSL